MRRCIAYCLKVDFCCDSADVDIVATYKKASRSQKVLALNAAVRIEDAIYHKVFDFEERTQEEVTKLPGSRVLGLAKRIKIYKNLYKYTQIYTNIHKFIQIYANLYKYM